MKIPYLAFRCDQLLLQALLISACAMGLTFVASQAFGASPVGLWYAEGGAAEVQVFACGDDFCGKVVWLRSRSARMDARFAITTIPIRLSAAGQSSASWF